MEPTKLPNGLMDSTKKNVNTLSHEAGAWVEAEIDSISKFGEKSAKEVKRMSEEAFHEASTSVSRAAKKTVELVRRNPMTTVAAVLAVGYVAARMFNGKKHLDTHQSRK